MPEIQGASIEYIAEYKATYASKQLGCAVITEDTCLCFDALNGLPGPYIKWFLDKLGHVGLNKMISGFDDKSAKAVCTLAYCEGPESEPMVFQGVTDGTIVMPRGPLNFGWDPIFQPNHPSMLTFAEMDSSIKNSISHRYKALDLMKSYFMERDK